MPRRLTSATPSNAHRAIGQVAAPRPTVPAGHPFDAEIEAERIGWTELLGLVRSLDESEVVEPGYVRDPDWSLTEHSDAAAWWVKAGADHYNEHLGRLRDCVAELRARRETPLAHGRAATARTGRR